MVSIGEHNHDDGNVCPGCRFRMALAEFLARAHEDGRQEWHWAVGDLRQSMHAALLALDAIEAAAFDDDPDDADDDAADDAAKAIADVGAEIQQLWHALTGTDDGQ